MEAPPGFEPGMEVLQTYPVAKRCLPDLVEIRICLNNSMSFAVTTLSPNHEVLARRRDSKGTIGDRREACPSCSCAIFAGPRRSFSRDEWMWRN